MEIIINGNAKEIAALVSELQKQLEKEELNKKENSFEQNVEQIANKYSAALLQKIENANVVPEEINEGIRILNHLTGILGKI